MQIISNGVNYKADKLAKSGTSVYLAREWERVKAPLASGGSLLDGWCSGELGKRWLYTCNCAIAKLF